MYMCVRLCVCEPASANVCGCNCSSAFWSSRLSWLPKNSSAAAAAVPVLHEGNKEMPHEHRACSCGRVCVCVKGGATVAKLNK